MNTKISNNFKRLKATLYVVPFLLLIIIFLFLYLNDALNVVSYINIQKDWFYFFNKKLSKWPHLEYNLTQFGDAFVFMSLLTIFIIKAPKLWHALTISNIISAILTKFLKNLFCVPRPTTILPLETINIIGKPLFGQTNSLPSGHAVTTFTILTVILFAILPNKIFLKIYYVTAFLFIGLFIAFTRVGIGVHYPLDVIIGGIIGYISGVSGILIQNKYNLFFWIGEKKYYPFFVLLLLVCMVLFITKILAEQLIVFYFALISIIFTLYLIILGYVKK